MQLGIVDGQMSAIFITDEKILFQWLAWLDHWYMTCKVCVSASNAGELQLVKVEMYTRAVFYGWVLVQACYSSWLLQWVRRPKEAEFTYQEHSGNFSQRCSQEKWWTHIHTHRDGRCQPLLKFKSLFFRLNTLSCYRNQERDNRSAIDQP